jgi:integrase
LSKPKFKEFALQFIENKRHEWRNIKHGEQWGNSLRDYAFNYIGDKYLDEIDTQDLLNILQPIWLTKTETANRVRGRIQAILSAATTLKFREGINPAILSGHLDTILSKPYKTKRVKHQRALDYKEIPKFIEELQGHDCMAAYALEFTILNAARTGETLKAKRSEIQDDLLIIPAERMKAFKEHRIPLTVRTKQLIQKAIEIEPDSEYIFSNKGKSMSCNAMLCLIRRMGYDITTHGFRRSFKEWATEESHHPYEAVEISLAHNVGGTSERSYWTTDLIEKRKTLIHDWMNYCLNITQTNVIEIKQVA